LIVIDRRRHPRTPISECGLLCALDPTSLFPELDARITDVSDGGLGVLTDHPVPVNLAVKVVLANHVFVGEVAHCHHDGDAWAVGLEVRDGSDYLRSLRDGAVMEV
jgi:hypothetical protein